MPTSYPGGLDTAWVNPGPSSYEDDPAVYHDVLHSQVMDAIKAIEAKLGIGASTAAAGQVLRATGAGASAFGALQTGDITAGAITQILRATPTTAGPTIASGTPTVMPQMSVSITTLSGSTVLVLADASIGNNGAAGVITVTELYLDGSAIVHRETTNKVTSSNYYEASVLIGLATGLSAGAHTFELRWWVTGGTAQSASTARSLTVIEFKK